MKSIPLDEIAANLNMFSWKILELLSKIESSNFLEMKRELELSQEKSYKELARLEGALLIVSKRDPRDQRSVLYSITEYGKNVLSLGK